MTTPSKQYNTIQYNIDSKVIDQSEQIYQNSNSSNQCIMLAFGQILTLFRNHEFINSLDTTFDKESTQQR